MCERFPTALANGLLTMDELIFPAVARFSFDTDGDLVIEVRDVFDEECYTRYLAPEQTRRLFEFLRSHHSAKGDE